LDAGAQRIDDAGDLVSRHARVLQPRPLAFLRECIAVADAAGVDSHQHLAGARLRHLAFDDLDGAFRLGDHGRLHLAHVRLLAFKARNLKRVKRRGS
jgi:hypothetical protein